jgi:hypothetical protein
MPFVVNTIFSTGLVGVVVTSVSWLGELTVGVYITDYCNCWFSKFCLLFGLGQAREETSTPTRAVENVFTTKGLQERNTGRLFNCLMFIHEI